MASITRTRRELKRRFDLTVPQSDALLAVAKGPKSMGELKEITGCNITYVTTLVDGLEQRQFVSRDRSDTDRRVVMVTITEQGAAIAESVRAQVEGGGDHVA